jgi:hypothetical protein
VYYTENYLDSPEIKAFFLYSSIPLLPAGQASLHIEGYLSSLYRVKSAASLTLRL